jgi:hypothetical protein
MLSGWKRAEAKMAGFSSALSPHLGSSTGANHNNQVVHNWFCLTNPNTSTVSVNCGHFYGECN